MKQNSYRNRPKIFINFISFFTANRKSKSNPTIHFIHRIDESNIGDMVSCPMQYFDYFNKFNTKKHDIYNIKYDEIKKNDIVILGGGGLFNCLEKWNKSINQLFDACDCIIGWGPGFNSHTDTKIKTEINFEKFRFLSIRDYKHKYKFEYIPCVSCMIPQLSNKYKNKRKIGVIEHKDFPINNFNYDKISNNQSVDNLLEFIGASDIIITNTYHACYFATLMNKKVILFGKFSDKFNHFKYPPNIYSGNIENDIKMSKNYPMAIKDSVNLNINFSMHIREYLRLFFHCG